MVAQKHSQLKPAPNVAAAANADRAATWKSLYLASHREGFQPVSINGSCDVPVGTEQVVLFPETPKMHGEDYIIIIAHSPIGSFLTSFYARPSQKSKVEDLQFIEMDLDPFQIGGMVTWTQPNTTIEITHSNTKS
jgi:hypothetical protein